MSDELAKALDIFQGFGCPVCHGDCASANPPVSLCPMQIARAALTAYEDQGGRRTAEETIEMLAQAHEMEKRVLYEALERALSHFAVMNSEQSARAASEIEAVLDRTCSVCGGDCASANPPVVHCPNARAALTAYEAHAKATPSERETGWLIERKYPTNTIGATEPRWYAERVNGDHWWTPVPNDAKRFSSKNEAEAYPAYKMIAGDPTINITEHMWINDGFSWSHGQVSEERGVIICPDCRGERRGANGLLCSRCGGTAQIRRQPLRADESAPFEANEISKAPPSDADKTTGLPKATGCSHCDFSSGTRGMDRCRRCDGTGSVFRVGEKSFPNTREGYEKACEAAVASLVKERDEARRMLAALAEDRMADLQKNMAPVNEARERSVAHLLIASVQADEIATLGNELAAAQAEAARMREALAFYGEAENYNGTLTFEDDAISSTAPAVLHDNGDKARAALNTETSANG